MTITVGALTNVPAPNDPIRSPWAQQVSAYAVHPFASASALNTQWPAAPDGSMAVTTDTGIVWERRGGIWRPIPGQVLAEAEASGTQQNFTSAGLRDMYFSALPTVPYPTIVTANGVMWFGAGAGVVTAAADITRLNDGSSQPITGGLSAGMQCPAGYAPLPMVWSWTVAAGANPNYKTRCNVIVSTASCWVQWLGIHRMISA